VPRAKIVKFKNLGGGELAKIEPPKIEYETVDDWLEVVPHGEKNGQWLEATADANGLRPGTYSAQVSIACPNVANPPQSFRVELRVPDDPPRSEVTIDDRDPGFFATPYFWVGHRFCRCPIERRGCGGFYLTNGGRPVVGEFARFTPDLHAGRYEVSLDGQTPFRPGTQFDVLVRHRSGETLLRIQPEQSRVLGTFEFDEGADGFVELRCGGSRGLVIADAVAFQRAAAK